ncbi:tRNA (N6-isopentenyl adenosine(37)-C2)-methylthiotransferase MiaB [Candidatus Zixiibacteriota bacterium]
MDDSHQPDLINTVYIETYGCQMNVRDTEMLGGIFRQAGCDIADTPETADLILLNTCAVRERAEQRVIGRVTQLFSLKKRGSVRIGVVGCMAQHLKDALLESLPDLDFVLGPDTYRTLPELFDLDPGERRADWSTDRKELYEGIPSWRGDGDPSAFVTVMRGCDMMCTFCVVPHTRGRERCRTWREIVSEVSQLADDGVMEVVLLGQTVNAWQEGEMGFGDLLRKVSETGIPRVRFTSPHPLFYGEDELKAIAECDNVCESVHLPVQSGNTDVLNRMNRRYTREEYLQLVRAIGQSIPHVTLSTDIIVGFPGETASQFEDTLSLMEECSFDSGYLFKYSPRTGTRAEREFDDDVPADEKQRRLERVIELQTELTRRSLSAMVGGQFEILIDGTGERKPHQWTGRTRGNRTVVIESEEELLGRLVQVVIEEAGTWTLRGRLIE